jgi:hypothetical protein
MKVAGYDIARILWHCASGVERLPSGDFGLKNLGEALSYQALSQ